MKRRLPTSTTLLLMFATPSQAQPSLREVYRLTEIGERTTGGLDQTLSFLAAQNVVNPERWIIERVRVEFESCGTRSPQGGCRRTDVRSHDWIDSESCPSLVPALEHLAQIQVPPFAGPVGITTFDVSHVTVLTIEGQPKFVQPGTNARYGGSTLAHIAIREQVGFFRQWWSKTEAALKPCWQDAAPKIAGKRLGATLDATP